jgi:hypothetical protein
MAREDGPAESAKRQVRAHDRVGLVVRVGRVVFGLVAVGLLGACEPGADPPTATQGSAVATYTDPSHFRLPAQQVRRIVAQLEPGSPQRVILADAHVSRPELDAAWDDYEQCMRRAGFPVTTSAWNPVTNTTRIFTYARAATATGSSHTAAPPTPDGPNTTTKPSTRPTLDSMTDDEGERVDACDEDYWFPVSAIYAADTPSRMDPQLASAMAACMAGRGYAVRGETSFAGMVGAVGGRAQGVRVRAGQDCLSAVFPDLYPDLPYLPTP